MRTTLFKEVGYTLSKLIHDIDLGEIGLPDIQRPFVWTAAKVRDLFDSMYKGFPVGYLLFWSNGVGNGARQIGTDDKQQAPRLLIVDGQQRLTSLYAVLKGKPVVNEDYVQQHINIAFRPSDAKFEVSDAAIRRDPEFIADISKLWAGEVSRNRFVKDFIARLREHREVSEKEDDDLNEALDRLYDLHSYPFTALELSTSVDEEHVAEVFVRINSKGVTLNQADFILTLMSVFWDEGRKALESFCRAARQPSVGTASPFNYFFAPDPDHLLRTSVALGFRRARLQHVYSILRGKDLDSGQFSDERRVQQFEVLKGAQAYTLDLQNWHEFLKVLLKAGFRSGAMISSQVGLLYSYSLFLIGKRDYQVDHYQLRQVISRWYFMTALTGRYTSSPESVMETDLARLRKARNATEFIETLDHVANDALTDDYWNITLPNELATPAARSPALFAYHAALNLLEARALFSDLKVSELLDPSLKARKTPVERHHLFAKGYLHSLGLTDIKDTNQIANYAWVEWRDNVDITDRPPRAYVPEYSARFTPEVLKQMRYWHALPDGWENLDYREFLEQRRKLMAGVVRDGFGRLAG